MTSNLNRFKARTKVHLRKKAGLIREMEEMWNREIPQHRSSSLPWELLSCLASDLFDELDIHLHAGVQIAVRNRDLHRYLDLGAVFGDVQLHSSPRSFIAASTVINLLKKFPWVSDKVDPLSKAKERFYEAEELCLKTNRRLRHFRQFDFASRVLTQHVGAHQIFHLARRKIQSWIGECEVDEVLSRFKHGPGGVVGLRRPYTTPYYKFSADSYTVSTGSYFYAARAFATSDAWVRAVLQNDGLAGWDHPVGCVPVETKLRLFDQRVEIANYNNVTFVPKNAKTHRAIAIEPSLNVMLQLAVGTYLKECLARAGCDLHDQTRNQELARIGSIQQDSHDPVTLDMSMASDTLSIELVRELLPPTWFNLLWSLRSREGRLDGKAITWEKFSSMGNGFTFELESLIFLALAQSVSDLEGETDWFADTFGPAFKYAYVSVYGDDIIVPSSISTKLIKILNFSGFQLNLEKSYTSGPFRESCGKDYYGGVLVRPYYLSRSLTHVKDLIHLLNNLKITARDFDFNLAQTCALVEAAIPGVLRKHLRGPRETKGDEHIWSDPDDCHTSSLVVWDTDMQTWTYPTIKPTLSLRRGSLIWRYCQFLYSGTGTTSTTAPSDWSRDQFALHVSGGGSAGDVVLSGQNGSGKVTLIT